jgi:hypothetical protein
MNEKAKPEAASSILGEESTAGRILFKPFNELSFKSTGASDTWHALEWEAPSGSATPAAPGTNPRTRRED